MDASRSVDRVRRNNKNRPRGGGFCWPSAYKSTEAVAAGAVVFFIRVLGASEAATGTAGFRVEPVAVSIKRKFDKIWIPGDGFYE